MSETRINREHEPDPQPARILIVASDPIVCDSLAGTLHARGFETATAMSADEAIDAIEESERTTPTRRARPFNVLVTDVALAGRSGIELLRDARESHPNVVVVIVTAYGTIPSAVKAIKLGAFEYLTYPVVEDELSLVIEKAVRHGALLAQNSSLRDQLHDRYGFANLVGRDPRMLKIYDLVEAVAPTKTTVLMTGESGTGKSLIAKAIHRHSAVQNGPFVELACGSIPETLLESELFGHVKGAFTGAHVDKQGRFLAADGGTIFLDEINSASPGMQLKLLRVLQERQFEPVGSTETVEVDVRILLASNEPLECLVTEGRFRQDLYYRINVVSIELPPLRERLADVPILAQFFLEKYCGEHDRHIAGLTDDALEALKQYEFPGNVRELENIIERAVVLTRRGMIDVEDLPAAAVKHRALRISRGHDDDNDGAHGSSIWKGQTLADAIEEQERRILIAALDSNDWNRQQTADQLAINRTTLYKKIKQHGLDAWPAAG